MQKTIDEEAVSKAVEEYPTPFYLYDEEGIRNTVKRLNNAFAWNKGYKNYFAVKALPNPKILEIVLSEGMGLDCSSLTELLMAEKLGVDGKDIMFSSNDTSAVDFKKARELNAVINLDDGSHLTSLEEIGTLPELLCFRYNPGNLIKGNSIIGQPEEAKFGMTGQQIINTIKLAQQKGVKRFGLHTMSISNNLDMEVALGIVKVLCKLAQEIHSTTGVELEFLNLGGGIGIPYKSDDREFDLEGFAKGAEEQLKKILPYEPAIYTELGRYITGPHGHLISKVLHIKHTYKTYVGLDAAMHNLMRPGMYGAYHHIGILGKNGEVSSRLYDVTGSLCENNDKFAIDRQLPEVEIGDVVVVYDVGAHGHSMGFNYNGKLRSAEILWHKDGSFELVRRAERPEDYFATLNV